MLTDGHAGNVRQANALSLALGRRDPREWALSPKIPWRWWAPRRLPGAGAAFGPEFAQALGHPPALAIGCGRQGALATRLLRQSGCASVQILDPRLPTRHWDLVIAPEHDGLRGPNVITLLGSLHPVDDSWLGTARDAFPAFARLPAPRTALLIGGPGAHSAFDAAAVLEVADRLRATIAREGGSLLATTSRRTPADTRAALRERFARLPGVFWSDPGDGANPYAGLLGWADRVVCTADSVNMLSEAAATRVPVFAACADGVSGRPRRFLDSVIGLGRVRLFDETLAPFDAPPLRETPRVAAEVRRRLNLQG